MTDDRSDASLSYGELGFTDVNDSTVEDLNHLLSQLSTTANPLTTDDLHEILSSGVRFYVARDCGGTIIGTTLFVIVCIMACKKAWIEDVVVREDYRGRGVARRLIRMAHDAAEAEATEGRRPVKYIDLTSNPTREGARKLYVDVLGYEIRDTGVFRYKLSS